MALSLSTEKAVPLEYGDSSHKERAIARNDEGNSLVHSMSEKINALPKRPSTIDGPTIFRVPAHLRKNKENLIEPSVVSIGPYHRGRKHLAPMEDKKWLLLQDILSRPNARVTLKACVERVKGLQLQARSCYSESVDMDDDSFVEMLILDGTFIIQFLYKSDQHKSDQCWYERETGWAATWIATDLILLENQIPLFVVQSLWDLYFRSPLINSKNLKMIREILCPVLTLENITIQQKGFHHLLHLCHHCVVSDMSAHVTVLPGCSSFDFCTCVISMHENQNRLPGATELQNIGIKFRKKKSPCKMMDVTFQGGKLEIPFIEINDNTKPFFMNLLAFEQNQDLTVPKHLTSYASFMDSIINTEHDVAILQRNGIIGNMLSSEEEAALFFNQLCIGASEIEGHYLSKLTMEVSRHYDSKCHTYRAKLMRDYFNSPWSIISFIGALIILGLTFAQTYFAGDAYFHPSPK